MNRVCLVVASVVVAVACGGDKSSPAPTVPTTSTGTAFLSMVAFQGPTPLIGPGETAQIKVIASFSDGSVRDVTADATLASTQPQIATVEAGVIKGVALGRTTIRATYMNRNAFLNLIIQPAGTFIVSGNITEPVSVVVPNATVMVLAGARNSVTTTSFGFYELFGMSGTVTLRVSSPGYVDETRTLTVMQNERVNVEIRPIVAPASVAGTYGMTLTISPSCSIVPAEQRTRTYTATISQDAARLSIKLSDANFVRSGTVEKSSFGGKVSGSSIVLDFGDGYYVFYYGANVQETLPGGQILGIWGSMTVSAGQSMSGNLVGGFTYRENNRTNGCSGSDNRLVLTRR
jgi:Carboxypeptidase regulatory-like domain